MPRHRRSLLLLCIVLNLTACKVWHKQGADEADLRTDRQTCEEETRVSTGQVFVACMERLGWRHIDTAAPAGHSRHNRAAVDTGDTASVQAVREPGARATATEPQAGQSAAEAGAGSHKPDAHQRVGGWYRLSTEAGPLVSARSACETTGADNTTFIRCMEAHGWRPVFLRISVQEPGDLD